MPCSMLCVSSPLALSHEMLNGPRPGSRAFFITFCHPDERCLCVWQSIALDAYKPPRDHCPVQFVTSLLESSTPGLLGSTPMHACFSPTFYSPHDQHISSVTNAEHGEDEGRAEHGHYSSWNGLHWTFAYGKCGVSMKNKNKARIAARLPSHF